MAKNTFLSFSTTAGDNTDVGGIGILGSNAVSNFDNALRTLMSILRGDLDNGTVYVTKSAGYTAVAGDNNTVYEFTATATLALTAAATLAADWHMMVFANGGDVTVDPNGAELINGASTLTISNGDSAYIICTGTAFKAISLPSSANAALLSRVNTFTKTQKWAKGADVASAAALTLGTDGNYFNVTGTTTITSIATVGVGTWIRLHFNGILTLTHNATSLVLPNGGNNIVTAAGDEAEFVEYSTGNWRCVSYQRASPSSFVEIPSASLSGTFADLSFPANTKLIDVSISGLRSSTGSNPVFQLVDSGGPETTGAIGGVSDMTATSVATASLTSNINITGSNTSASVYTVGTTFRKHTGNRWVVTSWAGRTDSGAQKTSLDVSEKELSDVLTGIRLTFANGTDTFQAGGTISARYWTA